MKRYLAEITPNKRPLTQRGELRCSLPVIKFFGKYSLAAISPELVAKYRDMRLAGEDRLKDGKPRPRAPNTIRLELSLLGHLFTIAMKEWGVGLPHNPVLGIRKPAPGPGRNRRLTKAEEKKLFAAADAHTNPMLGWIARIALETGMRSSEIVTLRVEQVDTKRRIVKLENTKNTMPRTVPLSLAAKKLFDSALANPTRPETTNLIFFGEPGVDGARRPYNFNKIWLDIKSRVGVEDFHFHDLRHEAVSRFVEAGFSDQEVSAISGHKSMQMLKRYTHLRAEDLVSRLDNLAKRRVDTQQAKTSKP